MHRKENAICVMVTVTKSRKCDLMADVFAMNTFENGKCRTTGIGRGSRDESRGPENQRRLTSAATKKQGGAA